MKTNSLNLPAFELLSNTAEADIGRAIDLVRSGKPSKNILVELLSERHPVYKERPSYQMARIRGYAMASFAGVGLPDAALSFILDELQNGKNAYMVAGAARALRGVKHPVAAYATFLVQALYNIRYHDDSMSLDVFKPSWPLKDCTTAKREILLTLQWLRGFANGALPELRSLLGNTHDFDIETREEIRKTIGAIEEDDRVLNLQCCEIESKSAIGFPRFLKGFGNVASIAPLEVENQKGVRMLLEAVIERRPTVVAFFYTRCMNPNKCTLTINKLGWLQQELLKVGAEVKLNLLAFTYDPSYDTPSKMHVFGENRGLIFGPHVQMLRTRPEDFSVLSDFFQLGVNHVASTVNQHRLELFLLDQNGMIKSCYTRLQWDVGKVLGDIKDLLKKSAQPRWLFSFRSFLQHALFPVLLAFFPKCPMCWAVYLSAFGVPGLKSIPYSPWLIPFIIAAIMLNLIALYRMAKVRNGLTPFWLSFGGGILVIGPGYFLSNETCAKAGIVLIFLGALLNSIPNRQWSKLCYWSLSAFREIKKRLSLPNLLFGTKDISSS
ncbi:MAG: SCO family protein [Chitinophagaceae bacterium]